MEQISGNITEAIEQISGNISEEVEQISGSFSEGAKGFVYYEYEFNSNTDVWGLYSKHFGNIVSVELTNVDSYTINEVSESLPFAVELNTTYIIEITRTDSLLASSIKFKVLPSDYNELQSVVDFTIGDGRYTYLLGDNTDVNTNRSLLKFDNDLFVSSNYVGAGVWTVDPLVSTITLPELPVNSHWKFNLNIKTGEMLIVGYNTAIATMYFCKVNSSDNVTDLNGNSNVYTEVYPLGKKYLEFTAYDYINNYVYFQTFPGANGALVMLNLNDNTTKNYGEYGANHISYYYSLSRSIYFNPYKKAFVTNDVYNLEENKSLLLPYTSSSNTAFTIYSRKLNKYYKTLYTRFLNSFDEFGFRSTQYNTSGSNKVCNRVSFNQEDAVAIIMASMYMAIYRINEVNNGWFLITDTEAGETKIHDLFYAKNNIHIGLSNAFGRIHIIDTSDPGNTIKPDFGYYDLPIKCWSLYTNRLL